MSEITQSAICNTRHSDEQRCCRWLLQVSDRCHADRFPLSDGFLAHVLGVRAVAITRVLAELQRNGVLDVSPGHIAILDRTRMTRASCECYALPVR